MNQKDEGSAVLDDAPIEELLNFANTEIKKAETAFEEMKTCHVFSPFVDIYYAYMNVGRIVHSKRGERDGIVLEKKLEHVKNVVARALVVMGVRTTNDGVRLASLSAGKKKLEYVAT